MGRTVAGRDTSDERRAEISLDQPGPSNSVPSSDTLPASYPSPAPVSSNRASSLLSEDKLLVPSLLSEDKLLVLDAQLLQEEAHRRLLQHQRVHPVGQLVLDVAKAHGSVDHHHCQRG